MSPKVKRSYSRSQGHLVVPFNPGSNRIVRERSGTGRSGSPERSIFNWRQHDPVPFGWLQWMLRGGDVDSINLEGTSVLIGRRYIAGHARSPAQLRRVLRAFGLTDDDDELFNIWDIPIWTRVSALIDLRT